MQNEELDLSAASGGSAITIHAAEDTKPYSPANCCSDPDGDTSLC